MSSICFTSASSLRICARQSDVSRTLHRVPARRSADDVSKNDLISNLETRQRVDAEDVSIAYPIPVWSVALPVSPTLLCSFDRCHRSAPIYKINMLVQRWSVRSVLLAYIGQALSRGSYEESVFALDLCQ